MIIEIRKHSWKFSILMFSIFCVCAAAWIIGFCAGTISLTQYTVIVFVINNSFDFLFFFLIYIQEKAFNILIDEANQRELEKLDFANRNRINVTICGRIPNEYRYEYFFRNSDRSLYRRRFFS